MSLKIVQVDYVLARPDRTRPPGDLFCYFIEPYTPGAEEQREWSDDDDRSVEYDSDHEWQQFPHDYPPTHELRLSQLNLEVIKNITIWLELPIDEFPKIPQAQMRLHWEWLSKMTALETVHFLCTVHKYPKVESFIHWQELWLESPLLLGNIIHLIELVRKPVKFDFELPEDPVNTLVWTNRPAVEAFFRNKIDMVDGDAFEAYFPVDADEHWWWIQNCSRYRFVFGPWVPLNTRRIKLLYGSVRLLQSSQLGDAGESGEDDESIFDGDEDMEEDDLLGDREHW